MDVATTKRKKKVDPEFERIVAESIRRNKALLDRLAYE